MAISKHRVAVPKVNESAFNLTELESENSDDDPNPDAAELARSLKLKKKVIYHNMNILINLMRAIFLKFSN